MNPVRVELVPGREIKMAIDEFYKKNGSKATANDEDLFFVAFSATQIIGCVRYCLEENTPMLRTMYVDSSFRKKGIGRLLLQNFKKYLDENEIHNVFCLPFPHLQKFYGEIGFEVVVSRSVPTFLVHRATTYATNGTMTIYMRRP